MRHYLPGLENNARYISHLYYYTKLKELIFSKKIKFNILKHTESDIEILMMKILSCLKKQFEFKNNGDFFCLIKFVNEIKHIILILT